jgi:aminopeptidase N
MKRIFLIALLPFFVGCKTNKEATNTIPTEVMALPELTIQTGGEQAGELKNYQATNSLVNDLIHTKLEVKFDWEKQHLLGVAELTFKPYFYETDELVLDAKGFDIHSVEKYSSDSQPGMLGNLWRQLEYRYDGMKITIDLAKTYTRNDRYIIRIKYTAKPNELKSVGSAAITGDKGLYFINPLGEDPKKMPQIWTQGETESSSCWFPTIDSPNEKTTQELSITVKDKYKTLSNGKMVTSTKNSDGTRTDYWKQDLKHAPYLFMMAVGEFDITQDFWTRPDGTKMEVNYYTEPEYTPYAKDIFGKTPKMIQFFSDKLGVEYPWHKYNQIVVRDYVSGAMENTTAVIHGDFLYQTDRELLDSDNESIIAHELFHHWFGDLVTAESWSNLTINESFANYSQYLWDEYEHGREEADKNAYGEMSGYFMSGARSGYHDLVYFNYESEMEMFDGHSYNKGGRILHMLRYYLGDDAFFASLKHFLNKMKFKAAEAHDLRLSFEEVSGKDLNWFFNQWYFNKGHPTLNYTQSYNAIDQILTVTVEQTQNFDQFPVFQLPIEVDIYTANGKERKSIFVTNKKQSFEFNTALPLLVNFDAEKIILGKKKEVKSLNQWIYQLNNSPLYLDKKEAFAQIKNNKDSASVNAIYKLLQSSYYGFNNLVMSSLVEVNKQNPIQLKTILLALTENKKSSVRANGYKNLSTYYGKDQGHDKLLEKGLKDKSFKVMGVCLSGIAETDSDKAMELAKGLEKEKSNTVKQIIGRLYSEHGTIENHDFFVSAISSMSGFSQYSIMNDYSKFLGKLPENKLNISYPVFENVVESNSTWWVKLSGYQGLINSKNRITNRLAELETELSVSKEPTKRSKIEREMSDMKLALNEVTSYYNTLKSKEQDSKVLEYLENM